MTNGHRLALVVFFVLVPALVVGLAQGCGGKADTSDAAPSNAAFVFTVNRNGFNEIWLMDETGGHRRGLTQLRPAGIDASGSTNPSWSPDGKRIAFVSTGHIREELTDVTELYVMDADGANTTRLTSNVVPDLSPSWSPDGERIVFSRTRGWGTAKASAALYVMDSDGSSERLLYREKSPGGPVYLSEPSWSPDGSMITFTKTTFGRESLEVNLLLVRSDGTDTTVIAENATDAEWSPDGKRIAFVSIKDLSGETCFHDCVPSGEIYTADADGDNPKRLTTSEANDVSPTWSPDGKRIAFTSDRSNRGDHENEIWVVEATGGEPVRITDNSVWDLEPDWRGSG